MGTYLGMDLVCEIQTFQSGDVMVKLHKATRSLISQFICLTHRIFEGLARGV